jgi:hypothetical protein
MQYKLQMLKSPISLCFHANSWQGLATQGRHQVYMITWVNYYTVLQYYIACGGCASNFIILKTKLVPVRIIWK